MQAVDLDPGNPYALVYLRALYDRLDCVVGTGTGETVVSPPLAAISTGVAHHIACTRSATEQVLWVDGVRVGSVAPGPFPHPADGAWLALGGDFRTPAEAYTFRGTIDEVRISNVARYTGAGPFVPARRHTLDASTLALWHFDEGVGTVADNAAGPGRDGTVEGAVWVLSPDDEPSRRRPSCRARRGRRRGRLRNEPGAPRAGSQRPGFCGREDLTPHDLAAAGT